jgi:CelD/BcsL family acetyltransferase involved in cellulose biosynthesis
VRVERVSTPAAFGALAAAGWDDCVRAAPRPSPFLLHGWLEEWWRHFGAGHELLVLTATRDDGRLAGALPLYVEHRLGFGIARFIGGHESHLADVIVAPGEDPRDVARVLVQALDHESFALADLYGAPTDSRILLAAGGRAGALQRAASPVMLMPDGFEAAYEAKTSTKRRRQDRYKTRLLERLGPVEISIARTPAELTPALDAAIGIHRLRWAEKPDGSTFGIESARPFHHAAMQRLAELDAVRIVLLRAGGRPLAFHYYFALEKAMYVYHLAYDPDAAQLSPGTVTMLEAMRNGSAEGLTRVEFLGGDEPYKLELADHLAPLTEIVGFASNPLTRTLASARRRQLEARVRLKHSPRVRAWYGRAVVTARRLRR